MYQQTLIGSNEILIHTLVPDNISTKSYRKVLIAKLFFRQIISLSDISSVSVSDIMSTVASYFGLNTECIEREVEPLLSLIAMFFMFPICRLSNFLTFSENLSRYRILLIVLQILLILPFVPLFLLPHSIFTLHNSLYHLKF